MIVSAGREVMGDGTRKSRHCAAYYMLYASPVARCITDGCSCRKKAVRDTPRAIPKVQPRVEGERVSGLQSTAAIGQEALSSVLQPVTAHEGSIVTWWRGNG